MIVSLWASQYEMRGNEIDYIRSWRSSSQLACARMGDTVPKGADDLKRLKNLAQKDVAVIPSQQTKNWEIQTP